MAIAAGKLRERATFSKRGPPPTSGPDFGAAEGDWQPQFTVWAGVQHLRGSEPVLESRLEGRQPIVVTVHRSSQTLQITEAWRVELDQCCECRAYAIQAVTPHNDRTGIDFLCVFGGAVG